MKHALIGISLAVLAAGSAYALESERKGEGDGTLSRAQAQAVATRLFTQLDANKDGKLDATDREARRAELFDRLDTDRNGQLSREEFAARPALAEGGAPARPAPRAKTGRPGLADADRNGAISQAEFIATAMRRFDAADANKDGQVTRQERQAQRTQKRGQPDGGARPDTSPKPPAG